VGLTRAHTVTHALNAAFTATQDEREGGREGGGKGKFDHSPNCLVSLSGNDNVNMVRIIWGFGECGMKTKVHTLQTRIRV